MNDWTEDVEENMIEGFIASIFLFVFLGVGVVASMMMTTLLAQELVIGLFSFFGLITLYKKTTKE